MRRILTTSLATAAVIAFTAGTAMAFGGCSGGNHQQSVKTDQPVTTAQTPIPQPTSKAGG
jgi:hypothetical protein